MPIPVVAGMAALGAAGSIMDRNNKKGMTQDAGNPFSQQQDASQEALGSYLKRGDQAGSNEFQNDPVLGKLYNQGQGQVQGITDTLGRTGAEEQNLANRGFSMQPEDYEAYGQAAGNIARESGQGEASLSQALASHGLSNSGMAGRAFAGSQGNKMEQLRQSQMQMAQNRMQMNLQRLGQTRNFMNSLQGQQTAAQGQQEGFARGGINDKNAFAQNKAQMGQRTLEDLAGQSNENLAQQRAVAPGSFGSALTGGLMSGAMGGAQLATAMGGMGGGAAAGGAGGGGGRRAPNNPAQS